MKNKCKLAFLVSLLVISMVPVANFFVNGYPKADSYILQLLNGDAILDINVSKNEFAIYSKIFYGFISFSLSYIIVVIGSVVVFWVCLALIVKKLRISSCKHKLLQLSTQNR